jgi:hypothetical protein
MVASMMTATAMPTPSILYSIALSVMNTANTAAMMTAAPVTTPGAGGDSADDGIAGVGGGGPAFADPAEDEDVVVHAQAEQHDEHEQR